MASRLRTLALGSKPHINIVLNDEQAAYTTLDKLSGKVEIAVPFSTRFDDFDIQFIGEQLGHSCLLSTHAKLNVFIGTTKTYLDKMVSTPGLTGGMSAFHQFLKLRQPISYSCYPQPRILEPGQTYEFPFVFVIPKHLLPRVCKHQVHHESVRDCHLQLPPSLGTLTKYDDLGPDMAKIQYQIAARLTLSNGTDNKARHVATKLKTVRVIPTVDEQPPVNVLGHDSDYILRAEKSIKKGIFKGKLGSLVIEAAQPKSLRLPRPYSPEDVTVSTVATIKLRFDPADAKSQPPRLASLSSKLKSSTWYAVSARPDTPKKKDVMFDFKQGLHSSALPLSSRCMGAVEWTAHKESHVQQQEEFFARRDSAHSYDHQKIPKYPSPSSNYNGQNFWTAEIVVPVALPKEKLFVPTFHTCLVSRTYSLNLSLGIHSSGIGFPTIDLKLPLQLSAQGNGLGEIHSRSSSTVEEVHVEEFGAVDEQQQQQQQRLFAMEHRGSNSWAQNVFDTPESSDLPPEYEAYNRPIVGVAG
jgi:hypothetical protein